MQIHVQISPEANEEVIKKSAEHYNVHAKHKGGGYWKFSSDDPENFFWFGSNFPKTVKFPKQ